MNFCPRVPLLLFATWRGFPRRSPYYECLLSLASYGISYIGPLPWKCHPRMKRREGLYVSFHESRDCPQSKTVMLASGLVCILQGGRPRGGAELENPSSGSCFRINQLGDPEPTTHMCSLQAYFLSAEDRTKSAFLPPQSWLQTRVPRTQPQGFSSASAVVRGVCMLDMSPWGWKQGGCGHWVLSSPSLLPAVVFMSFCYFPTISTVIVPAWETPLL